MYRIRPATIADIDVLVGHRLAMFRDMGIDIDADALAAAFRAWLHALMPSRTYRAWLVETDGAGGAIVAGGGMTLLPWPPGPRSMADRMAFVYNVYTDRDHRRRGLGKMVMDAIHAHCREEGIAFVALNASRDGHRMYEAMGYVAAPNPMMFFPLSRYNPSAQA